MQEVSTGQRVLFNIIKKYMKLKWSLLMKVKKKDLNTKGKLE